MKKSLFVLFLIMFFVELAAADTFQIDPRYSVINFRIKHLMGYAVGTFTNFQGTIELNKDNTALGSIKATIPTDKIDTHLAQRDDDLKSEHFFDVAKYPEAKFESTQITDKKLKGKLTLKGVTKEVELDYQFFGTAKDQYGNSKTAISANGKVSRKDFGMDYNIDTADGKKVLGDEVELSIEAHGIIKKK